MRDAEIYDSKHPYMGQKTIINSIEYVLGPIYRVVDSNKLYIKCTKENGMRINFPLFEILKTNLKNGK